MNTGDSGENGVCVESITPQIGAVVRGLTLSSSPDEATLRIIRGALARHLVLVFEDQHLEPCGLRDFVSHFGPLFRHHTDEGVIFADGVPEVLQMVKEPDGTRLFGGTCWHADVTFRRPAGYLSVLHAKTLPPVGGDTGFASTVAAFAGLSSGMRKLLRGLSAVHSYSGPGAPDHPDETAIHPLVRMHPDSGEEGVYINRMFATRFVGMTEHESRPLIDFLNTHMTRPEFTGRISWKPRQLVMWDNRFTLHYPINDFTGHRRLLYRCTAMED